MSNLFGSKKISSDQNLIPKSMIYTQIYKKSVTPALIILIFVIALSISITYLVPGYIENIRQETILLESQSLVEDNASLTTRLSEVNEQIIALQKEYDEYYTNHPVVAEVDSSILNKLQAEIDSLKQELAALQQEALNAQIKEYETRYPIYKLSDYINSIRTDDIVIIAIEDIVSQTGSTGDSTAVAEPVVTEAADKDPLSPITDDENGASQETASTPASDDEGVESPKTGVALEYADDIGNYKLILRGFAHSTKSLAEFATELNDCPMLESTSILSIETHTVDEDTMLYAFEIVMIPVESEVER